TVRDAFRVAWFHEVPGGVHAGNVMAADGTIYVGNSTWEADSSAWYAITPEGSTLWTLSLPYYAASTIPAIGDDGTLYLASWYHDDGGRLIAIDAGGSIRWVLEDLERLHSSPALGPGGTIYVPGRSRVYAVDALGEIEWTYEAHDDVFFVSAPAVASDGTIYLGGEDRRLYALGPDGS